MKIFEFERDIEKVPTILGIRALYFWGFAGGVLVYVLLLVTQFNWWILGIGPAILLALYLYLLYRSNAFEANKAGDDKIPDVFSTRP